MAETGFGKAVLMRELYQFLIRIHPPEFRRRFGDQMMSVFDDGIGQYGFVLMLDGFISFVRQWLLRTAAWKFPLAVVGAWIQVFGFGMPIKGHQHWNRNMQEITPSVEQLIFLALALVGSLFVVIVFLIFWNAQFQRRRSAHYVSPLARRAARTHVSYRPR